MPLEDPIFERLDFGLREAHLLLDRVVLDVGLHRHRLLAELREPALVHRDVFLDRAAGVLVFGEMGLGRRATRWRASSSRASNDRSRSGSSASVRRAASAVVSELLEGDQAFEVRQHQPSKQQSPGAESTGLADPPSRCALADKAPLD